MGRWCGRCGHLHNCLSGSGGGLNWTLIASRNQGCNSYCVTGQNKYTATFALFSRGQEIAQIFQLKIRSKRRKQLFKTD